MALENLDKHVQMLITSGEIFSTGQICAKVSGQVGGDVIACSGGARCEDFSQFDCVSNEDLDVHGMKSLVNVIL